MKLQTNWKLKMFFVCSVFLCIRNTYLRHCSDLKSFWYQFNWNLTWLVLFFWDSRAFILFGYCYCWRFITSPGEYSKILIWRKTYTHLSKEEDEWHHFSLLARDEKKCILHESEIKSLTWFSEGPGSQDLEKFTIFRLTKYDTVFKKSIKTK